MKNFKQYSNKIKIGAFTGIAVVIGCCSLMVYVSTNNEVKLNKNITIEYGEKYTPTLKNTVNNYKSFDEKDIKLTSTLSNEEGKDYPAVGNYKVHATYDKDTKTQKITVKDTIAPELTVPETIDAIQGTDLAQFDFKSALTATDLSQLNDYQIDYTAVDVNTVGSYTVKISVSDIYDNKSEKDLTMNIQEAPAVAADEVVVQEKVVDNSGKVTYKPVVKKATVAASSGQTAVSSPNIQKPTNTQTNTSTNTTPSTPTQTTPSTPSTPSTPKVFKAGDSFTFDYPGIGLEDGTIIHYNGMTATLDDNDGNFNHTETKTKNGHVVSLSFAGKVNINTGKIITKQLTQIVVDGVLSEAVGVIPG